MWLRDEEPEHYRAARWLAPVGGHLNGWLTGEVVPGPRQRVLDAALRPARRATGPRSWSSTRAWTREQLPAIRARRRRDRAAAARGRRRARPLAALPGRRRHRRRARRRARRRRASRRGSWSTSPAPPSRSRCRPPTSVLDDERLVETHAHAVDGHAAGREPRLRLGRQHAVVGRDARASRRATSSRSPRRRPPGSDGVLFLPTLSGSIAPRWNDEMRGCFAGLALNHDAGAPRARGARGLRVRAARHRRPLRRAADSAARRSASSAAARARRCGCRSRPTSPASRSVRCSATARRAWARAMLAGRRRRLLRRSGARPPTRAVELADEPVLPARGHGGGLRGRLPRVPARCSTASRAR